MSDQPSTRRDCAAREPFSSCGARCSTARRHRPCCPDGAGGKRDLSASDASLFARPRPCGIARCRRPTPWSTARCIAKRRRRSTGTIAARTCNCLDNPPSRPARPCTARRQRQSIAIASPILPVTFLVIAVGMAASPRASRAARSRSRRKRAARSRRTAEFYGNRRLETSARDVTARRVAIFPAWNCDGSYGTLAALKLGRGCMHRSQARAPRSRRFGQADGQASDVPDARADVGRRSPAARCGRCDGNTRGRCMETSAPTRGSELRAGLRQTLQAVEFRRIAGPRECVAYWERDPSQAF